jgi:hypothetical protein
MVEKPHLERLSAEHFNVHISQVELEGFPAGQPRDFKALRPYTAPPISLPDGVGETREERS